MRLKHLNVSWACMHTPKHFFFIIVSFICLCGPFILLQRHMAVIYNAHLFSLEHTSPYFVCVSNSIIWLAILRVTVFHASFCYLCV